MCGRLQVRQQMEEQMAQKTSELEQYLQRVRELEEMYHWLEEALEDEKQTKQDEEAMRKLQARSVCHNTNQFTRAAAFKFNYLLELIKEANNYISVVVLLCLLCFCVPPYGSVQLRTEQNQM